MATIARAAAPGETHHEHPAAADKYQAVDSLLDSALDDKANGIFRCRRDIFTNAALFELEMKHIFERNWVYRPREPDPRSTTTTPPGSAASRWSSPATRPASCTPSSTPAPTRAPCCAAASMATRAASPARSTAGPSQQRQAVEGEGREDHRISGAFNKNGSHDLKKVARFQSYRGFLFGSLSDDVLPLEEYLGETRVIIDQIVDQAPNGLKVLRGNSSYIYDGNWKMQMENGCDGYHVSTVHWNYAATMGRRKEAAPRPSMPTAGARRWRCLRLRARPHPAVDQHDEPGSAPDLAPARNSPPASARRAPTPSWPRRATCACIPTCS
jgi:benzoate/toluate 1,2-dioxygenase alpha subunit